MVGKEHVTRDDVARAAKVSSATVSRVFNYPESVNSEKVKRVLDASRSLGYVPDKNASALRRTGTGTIIFLEYHSTYTWSEERFYYWHYADTIKALKGVINASMYRLHLHSFEKPREILKLKGQADAIICHHALCGEIIDSVAKLGVPMVVCAQGEMVDCPYNLVYINEVKGGKTAGDYFRGTGHLKPAHITGNMKQIGVCKARWEGFRSAFQSKNKPFLIDGTLGIKGGYDSGLKIAPLIKAGKVDSIFVVNDLTAVGVVYSLMAKGISIPEQVSIIGYDNLPFVQTLPVELTTVDLGLYRLYTEASRLLLKYIQDSKPFRFEIAPEIVPGKSVINRPCRT
jgi:LacI family transcriptional regulator